MALEGVHTFFIRVGTLRGVASQIALYSPREYDPQPEDLEVYSRRSRNLRESR